MRKTRGDLTRGSPLRHLLRLSGPIILSYMLQEAFNIVDMIFVGRLGAGAIAAVGVSGNLIRLIGVFSLGISTGAGIMVAQYLGARNLAQAEHIAMQSILLAVFFSIGVTLVGYPLAEQGLLAVRMVDPEVLRLGTTYMHIILVGISTMFVSMTLGSIFRAGGDTITPMVVLIFATLINIVLDPLLIFGLWGFPKLGVAGSAYATLIGRGASVIILFYLCWNGRAPVSFRSVRYQVDLVEMLDILRLGVYSSMQGFWRHISRLGFLWVIGPYGKTVVAAYTICMRLRILVMNPGFGIANAVVPLVGQNLGANQVERAERSTRVANLLGAAIMTVIGAVFFLFPQTFIRIFTPETDVIEYRYHVSTISVPDIRIHRLFTHLGKSTQWCRRYLLSNGDYTCGTGRHRFGTCDSAFTLHRSQWRLVRYRPLKRCARHRDVGLVQYWKVESNKTR